MKWELDLWYEMWDRAGSQGLDTWYELPKEKRTGGERDAHRLPDVEGLEVKFFQSEPAEGGGE